MAEVSIDSKQAAENEIQDSTAQTNAAETLNVPVKNAKSISLCARILLGLLLLLCAIVAAITVPTVLLTRKPSQESESTSSTTSNASLVSATTATTTTTTTQATTTITCASGYVLTSSLTCVNTQIDFNNCGSVGFVCSANYTSCSAGVCSTRPAVQLSGAIAVPGWVNTTVDDATVQVALPINITLYNYTTSSVTVTSNGVLCLGSCSSSYSNGNLPSGSFGGPTVFGYWDDLKIYSGTAQTVYYATSGTAPNRITTFEFYESHYSSSTQYYHFQIIFYENQPNKVSCLYFDMTAGGASGTIGVQKTALGPNITYSVDQVNAVTYNTIIDFDTDTGTIIG